MHVLEVPRNLRRAATNEKQFAQNFFSREESRVEYMRRAGAEDAEGGGEGKSEAPPAEAKEGEPTPEEKLEAEFLALEEKFMEEMGLNQPDAPAPAEAE